MNTPNPTPYHEKNFPGLDVRSRMRTSMDAAQEWAYFDHAAVSPLPRSAADAGRRLLDESASSGDHAWPRWSSVAGSLRKNGATMLQASESEIAIIPNTTFGINLIARAFPWFDGLSSSASVPNVVVVDNEFSSNLLPWLELEREGVEVRRVPVGPEGIVSLEEIRKRIDPCTRLVSVSWVNYLSGYRLDLPALCDVVHGAGSELFLDAIQGLGVFPCDVSSLPIDYVAADGHKWLLGPEGAGILYIRKERLGALKPIMVGWNSLQGAHQFGNQEFKYKDDATKFEGGSANHLGIVCLEQSTKLLLELGCHEADNGVMHCVLENAAAIEDGLLRLGVVVHRDATKAAKMQSHLSGILTFEAPGIDSASLRNELIRHKVMLSVRHGRMRVATHAYNNADDIERLTSIVQAALGRA